MLYQLIGKIIYENTLMEKHSSKLGVEGNLLNMKKGVYKKFISVILLNGEKPNAYPLRLGKSQRCPLSFILFIIVLKIQTGQCG